MNNQFLTDGQIESFLEDGYLILRNAIPSEIASQWADAAFERLGYDRHDPATWDKEKERFIMPSTREVEVAQFAPDVWKAACDLLGGADRIVAPYKWCDAFIMNCGFGADRPWDPPSAKGKSWHKDGDFFKHFLDSPEQALLPIVCWTDLVHRGGATFIATDSVGVVARCLADRPEGVMPGGFNFSELIKECHHFVELTANAGDVVVHHPFMLHGSSQNTLKVARVITNQSMRLREPMNFNRADPADFSIVELSVLRSLGVDRLDFRPTGARQRVIPERERLQSKKNAPAPQPARVRAPTKAASPCASTVAAVMAPLERKSPNPSKPVPCVGHPLWHSRPRLCRLRAQPRAAVPQVIVGYPRLARWAVASYDASAACAFPEVRGMKYFFRLFPVLLIAFVARAWGADAIAPAGGAGGAGSLFDPARHMHVSEVQPGMEGYGLTVFKGTKIEQFGVHVVSVLHNFNPRYDVVLIKCDGDFLEHTGSIAGMSGSPVFLKDDAGHYRMIGAFAYGWPLTKDPVAGVQPIEYMLNLPTAHVHGSGTGAATQPGGTAISSPEHAGPGQITWSVKDVGLPPRLTGRHVRPMGEMAAIRASSGLIGDGDEVPQLQPLTTPIMTSGLSKSLLKSLAGEWSAMGMTPLQAGGAGSVVPAAVDAADAKLEPGSVLAVPLLTGDVEMTAIGTCTEVLGDRVWGFGHPFNNEGPVALPLGTGYINGVIANLETSFKLGALAKSVGTLNTDGSVGVAGLTGHSPKMIPIEFTVTPADGSPPHTYHFQGVNHRKFTPMLAATAFSAAVTGSSDPPEHNTLDYDIKIDFANGQTLEIADTAVETQLSDLAEELTGPMTAASDNPFEQVSVEKITGAVTVSPVERLAQILEVTVPKSRVLPGETVKAFVRYQPFRAAEAIMPVELTLPRNIPEGQYQLVISDDQRFFEDEQQAKPFMFTAQRIGDVFAVLKDLAAIRSNAIYLRLIRQPDGVAIGRTAMGDLPSSMRTVLMGAGRSTITPFVSSTVKIVPTEMVIKGAAEFTITVDNNAKLAVTAQAPAVPVGH